MASDSYDRQYAARRVQALIAQMGSPIASQRNAAEADFRRLNTDEVAALIRLAREAKSTHAKTTVAVVVSVLGLSGILISGAAAPMIVGFGLPWFVLAATVVGRTYGVDTAVNITWALRLVDDTRVLGPLIWRYAPQRNTVRAHQREAVRDVILLQLHCAGPEYRIDLTITEREAMRVALRDYNPALVCSILRAFEQIGNHEDLAEVKQFGTWPAKAHPEVKEAAISCREAIVARLANAPSTSTLLRASQPPNHPDTLLRAAGSAPIRNADELPRVPK